MALRVTCTAILTVRLNNGEGYQASNGHAKFIYPWLDGLTETEQHIRAAYIFRDWLAIYAPFGDKTIWLRDLQSARIFNRKFCHIPQGFTLTPSDGKQT